MTTTTAPQHKSFTRVVTHKYFMDLIKEAHGALVSAAKEAHLAKHPQAEAISKLIDALEDIDLEVCGKVSYKGDKV